MLTPFIEVVDKAKEAVEAELGQEKASRTSWIMCDLGDWNNIPAAAKKITDATDRLDILVNNAGRGIMTSELTDFGVERHMAVNHMGHAILTAHLLDLMKKTASADNIVRITVQSSNLHEQTPKDPGFSSLEQLNKDMGPALGPAIHYGRSKLAGILYSRYLARHLTKQYPKILVNATHPGVVDTDMSRNDIHEPYPLAGYGMSVLMAPFKKNQFEGALSTL